jgi:hypothetical protein
MSLSKEELQKEIASIKNDIQLIKETSTDMTKEDKNLLASYNYRLTELEKQARKQQAPQNAYNQFVHTALDKPACFTAALALVAAPEAHVKEKIASFFDTLPHSTIRAIKDWTKATKKKSSENLSNQSKVRKTNKSITNSKNNDDDEEESNDDDEEESNDDNDKKKTKMNTSLKLKHTSNRGKEIFIKDGKEIVSKYLAETHTNDNDEQNEEETNWEKDCKITKQPNWMITQTKNLDSSSENKEEASDDINDKSTKCITSAKALQIVNPVNETPTIVPSPTNSTELQDNTKKWVNFQSFSPKTDDNNSIFFN